MNTDISTEYQQECSFPIRCECGKRMLSTSLFRHRKTKTHILIMQKPENINIIKTLSNDVIYRSEKEHALKLIKEILMPNIVNHLIDLKYIKI